MSLLDSLQYQPVELTFGTSGLRGLITEMTDLECYINTKGFLNFLINTGDIGSGATVYVAGDLRDSTPRIVQVVTAAIKDAGFEVGYCGFIPTPAVAAYALGKQAPCIMVTGSHIPADRNGIKFYKSTGEVLKADEKLMQQEVANVRTEIYSQSIEDTVFDHAGNHTNLMALPEYSPLAQEAYIQRFLQFFPRSFLTGKHVVVYQHSAVGRDMLVELLEKLGATVSAVQRSDSFVPIDTENVRATEKALFKEFADQNAGLFAVVSTDGDSDRPFVVDETGEFHRGDVLGLVVTKMLGATFAAVPISANDAVDAYCQNNGITLVHTRIGSPYVIVAMEQATSRPAVGWEVNGGYLTGNDITVEGRTLTALPTRDAFLPILAALYQAASSDKKVSELFAALPARFTGGGLIDNVPPDQIASFKALSGDIAAMQTLADQVFDGSPLGKTNLDTTDGLRLVFETGDVIHLRPSGNAPQFRVYTNADTQDLADTLADQALDATGYIATLLEKLVN